MIIVKFEINWKMYMEIVRLTRETTLNEKLVYGINSSFKRTISVKGGFATYRGLLKYV